MFGTANAWLVAGGLAFLSAGGASAADVPASPAAVVVPAESPWELIVTPYLWAASLEGDVAVGGLPAVAVDAGFGDILDALDFGVMGTTELRYGAFGLFSDLFYVKLSGNAATPFGILADSASLDTSLFMFTGAAEYRLIDNPGFSLDAMAGLRVWSVDTEIALSGGLLDGASGSDGDTWADPLIGAKARIDLTPNVFLSGWAMVGGFGVSSDFMWDATAGIGYQFNDTISATIGYRGTGVDYEADGFLFDVIQHGPVSSLSIKF